MAGGRGGEGSEAGTRGSAGASADSIGESRRCVVWGSSPGTQRSAPRRPRRRPKAAGAGTPGPRRGGAGICPARRPGTCNGSGFSSLSSVIILFLWLCFALVGFLSCVVDPGDSIGESGRCVVRGSSPGTQRSAPRRPRQRPTAAGAGPWGRGEAALGFALRGGREHVRANNGIKH